MSINSTVFLITAFAFVFTGYNLAAQQVETVTKTVTKQLPLSTEEVLNVAGEKATIHVKGWDKKYALLKITFQATHASKKIATQELEFMHYAITCEKSNIEIRNAFILPPATDYIQSKLEVVIELSVPAACQLSVSNKYGNAHLSKLSGRININLEFSDLDMSNISGTLAMKCAYSEVHGQDLSVSSLKCDDEKSQIFMGVSGGALLFNSKHSDLDLTLKTIRSLRIESSRTNITISTGHFALYNYRLVNKEGKIYLPAPYDQQVNKEGKQNSLSLITNPPKPFIQITTTYNTITLK
jgi:hypothetical protein